MGVRSETAKRFAFNRPLTDWDTARVMEAMLEGTGPNRGDVWIRRCSAYVILSHFPSPSSIILLSFSAAINVQSRYLGKTLFHLRVMHNR